jgi:putative membrane protein
MDSTEFGILAMLAFWASAVGGIVLAIHWAKSRNRGPSEKELLMRSLKRRLEDGEISHNEFQKRVADLERE